MCENSALPRSQQRIPTNCATAQLYVIKRSKRRGLRKCLTLRIARVFNNVLMRDEVCVHLVWLTLKLCERKIRNRVGLSPTLKDVRWMAKKQFYLNDKIFAISPRTKGECVIYKL